MFANATQKVGISQRVVATLVACALVLMSIGFYTTAQAASLTYISDTLGDSAPGVTSAHTISYTLAATSGGLANGNTSTITFEPGSFAIGSLASGEITVRVNGVIDPHAGFATTTNTISFNQVAASAGQEIEVAITTGNITNPAIGSYDVNVSTGGGGDTGKTMVAIVNTVLVTAKVDTTFTFTVTGIATSSTVNGNTTTGSTTPTAINYGYLVANTPEVLAQRLNVSTNAQHGFVVTVESDGNLRSANGADIDNFDDASDVAIPGTAWNAPTPNISNENTWGHWGVTTSDANIGTVDGYYSGVNFGSNEFVAASTSPRAVFAHTGPADGTTNYMGSSTVAYKVAITALQEAADDYQTTLTYIATPTF
jgi:hypothetical protein